MVLGFRRRAFPRRSSAVRSDSRSAIALGSDLEQVIDYPQVHEDWARKRGILVLDTPDPLSILISEEEIRTIPASLQPWVRSRLAERCQGAQFIGQGPAGGPYSSLTEIYGYSIQPEWYRDWQRQGLFPQRPLMLFTTDLGVTVAETVGERSGWLYWYPLYESGHPPHGPFAKSLESYLEAIRILDSYGLMDVTDPPGWLDEPSIASVSDWPPLDTRGELVGISFDTVGEYAAYVEVEPRPIAPSIRDLLPNFDFI